MRLLCSVVHVAHAGVTVRASAISCGTETRDRRLHKRRISRVRWAESLNSWTGCGHRSCLRLRQWAIIEKLTARKATKAWEFELEAAVAVGEQRAEASSGRSTIDASAVERKAFAVFTQFHLQSLDLTAQKTVLLIGSI